MTALRLSVVVASFGRPDALRRCLLGLSQLADPGVEVVVVADRAGLDRAATLPFSSRLKAFLQAAPNVARARNIGIAQAAGSILAFLDDDAVPEPTWARALLRAFEDPHLAAATGPVLGRNGISVQWGPMGVDCLARDHGLARQDDPGPGQVRKLHGTNMAIRRRVFERVGGFDEAFAFYLDDTDIAWRVAQHGGGSAWVPGAVVHHAYAASSRRSADRLPLSLFDIGASAAVFLRKHAPPTEAAAAQRRIEGEQGLRLLRLARSGRIDARAMRDLMESLKAGQAEGALRASAVPDLGPVRTDFAPLRVDAPPAPLVLAGGAYRISELRRRAEAEVAGGRPVSLFCFSPSPARHRVRFTDGGWWEQTGGVFGASDRRGPALCLVGFRRRVLAEVARVAPLRGLGGTMAS